MNCPRCNKEIQEESAFCSFCGTNTSNLTGDENEIKENELNTTIKQQKKPKNDSVKRISLKKFAILLSGVLVISILGYLGYKQVTFNLELNQFRNYIADEKLVEAESFYSARIGNDKFIVKANQIMENIYEEDKKDSNLVGIYTLANSSVINYNTKLVNTIENDAVQSINALNDKFINKSVEYNNVISEIKQYKNFNDKVICNEVETVVDAIDQLNSSREAFTKGMKQSKDENYYEALIRLAKVIKTDENYTNAQTEITKIVPLYKKETLINVDALINKNDYSGALTALNKLNDYCSDKDISKKISSVENQQEKYEKEQEKIRISKLKDNQEVYVKSTDVWDDGYSIVFMKGEVVIYNASRKVAKEVKIRILQFDAKGYPVDVEYSIYQGKYSNEYNCSMGSCNVEPEHTYGSSSYYNLPDQCKKIKACVKSVTYLDGTTWENEYYDYWVEANNKSY